MQGQNVTQAQFNTAIGSSATGLSGAPLHRQGRQLRRRHRRADCQEPVVVLGSTDYQDINKGVPNFFDTSIAGCNPPPSMQFAQLSAGAGAALAESTKTTIQDFNGKLNYQLNTTNKFQFLMQSDRKLRNNR